MRWEKPLYLGHAGHRSTGTLPAPWLSSKTLSEGLGFARPRGTTDSISV